MADYLGLLLCAAILAGSDMKKLYPKRPKHYKPIRIIGPADHTAKVYPRQSIKVVLDKPSAHFQAKGEEFIAEDAQFQVVLAGAFLFIERVEKNRKGQDVYIVSQKYDLSDWACYSEMFLGEIKVELVNSHPRAEELKFSPTSVGVYHVGESIMPPSARSQEVLTAVNPDQVVVKLEPERFLEVVVYEDEWTDAEDEWTVTVEDFEALAGGIFVRPKKQTFFDTAEAKGRGSFEGLTVIPRHRPPVNAQLQPGTRNYIEENRGGVPGRQHHFWFSFTQESLKNVRSRKNGAYPVARVILKGRTKDRTTSREFVVSLSLHGKPMSKAAIINRADAFRDNPKAKVLERVADTVAGLLRNPGPVEQLDLLPHQDEFCIEIPNPGVFWPSEPADAAWIAEFDQGYHKDCQFLKFAGEDCVTRWGVNFQRFKVERTKGVVPAMLEKQGQKFLGSVKLHYPPKGNLGPDACKIISIWVMQKPVVPTYSPRRVHERSHHHNNYAHAAGCYGGQKGPWKQGVGYWDGIPRFAVLKVEEIEFKNLEDQAFTKRVYHVPPMAEENYTAAMSYRSSLDKKKAMRNAHVLGAPPSGSSVVGSGGNSKESSTSSSDTSITASAPTGTSSDVRSSQPPSDVVCLLNPAHLQEVTLQPGQELVLRLSAPSDMLPTQELRDKVRGELWTVNMMAMSDVKPIAVYNRVMEVASGKYCHEARIKPDLSRIPDSIGNHSAGAVRLECSAGSRVLRMHVKKGLKPDPSTVPAEEPKRDFLTQLHSYDANGRHYLSASSWKHNQSVAIRESEVLYVKSPAVSAEWSSADPSVRFIQYPIPDSVWDRLSNNLRNVVDRHKPWYNRDFPLFLYKTLYFKPLEQCCPNFAKLVAEVRDIVSVRYIPLVTLIYENVATSRCPEDNGVLTTTQTLSRELHVCLDLGKKPEKEPDAIKVSKVVKIKHPGDMGVYNVLVGDLIEVELLPVPADDGGEYPWAWDGKPCDFLSWDGLTVNTGQTLLRFKVIKPGLAWIGFKCHGATCRIQVLSSY